MGSIATFSYSSCTCTIAGTPVELEPNTLDAQNTIQQRSQTTFDFHEFTGVLYDDGSIIEIKDPSGDTIYTGFIDSDIITFQGTTPASFYHQANCKDNQYYAERRLVAKSYNGSTGGFIANDLWNTYLRPDGVTIGGIDTGALMPPLVFNYQQLSLVLNNLAAANGFWWNIDELRRFWFKAYGGISAPWTYDGTQSDNSGSNKPKLASGNPEYRNKQYAIGGFNVTGTLTEMHVGDGTSKSIPLRYDVSAITSVTIGGVTQTLNTKGQTNAQVYYAVGDSVLAIDDTQSAPGAGVSEVIVYKGRYPTVAVTQNNSQINYRKSIEGGGTGLYESAYVNAKMQSLTEALQIAQAELNHFGQSIKTLTFRTPVKGLHEGQLLTVNFPAFCGLSENMLIQTCEIKEDAETIWYYITALGSPIDVTWQTFFQALVNNAQGINSTDISPDTNLSTLIDVDGSYTLAGTVSRTHLGVPITSGSLITNTTLITAH